MHLLMCSSPLDKRKPDDSYQEEYDAAKHLTKVHLFDIFNVDSLKLPPAENQALIYHGWMMPPAYYKKFYNKCKEFGYNLINTPEQYKACHYFDGWYPALEGLTPQSTIVKISDLRTMAEEVSEFIRKNDCSVIIKDYVKSLKHNWHEACFIPKDASLVHLTKVISTFLSIKNELNDLQGNLVVRKFLDIKTVGNHPKSGMPLSKEFRTFVLDGELLSTFNYWAEGDYTGTRPTSSFIVEVARRVYEHTGSKLFTVDVAQLQDGSWTCIEVGDGQVSAIPDQENKKEFFDNLLK